MPVVFLTARGMKSDSDFLGYQAGCDAYLSKPFDRKQLISRSADRGLAVAKK